MSTLFKVTKKVSTGTNENSALARKSTLRQSSILCPKIRLEIFWPILNVPPKIQLYF